MPVAQALAPNAQSGKSGFSENLESKITHDHEIIKYKKKNLSLILKNIFSKMAKTTRQRFTLSASSGQLSNNSSLIFEKLVIYMLTLKSSSFLQNSNLLTNTMYVQ